MRDRLMAILLGLALAAPAVAAAAAPQDAGITTAETVLVTGEQPGPGLWLVRSADGQRDLYILGTLSPLPAHMQLQSARIDAVVANAQEVLLAPQVRVDFKDTGFFKSLFLLPSLLGARKNPDGRRLEQVVSPQAYARWRALKARYIGSDRGIEGWRPLFAAMELYERAIKRAGMDTRDQAKPVVAAAIERHHPNVTPVKVEILLENPRALIKEFSRTSLDDVACFEKTMDRIEGDLGAMRSRANAWATGDTLALQELPFADQYEACKAAVSEAGIGRRLGFGDAERRLQDKWMATAEGALARNRVTFATLPLREMLGPDGYLARLRARGYTVLAPDE